MHLCVIALYSRHPRSSVFIRGSLLSEHRTMRFGFNAKTPRGNGAEVCDFVGRSVGTTDFQHSFALYSHHPRSFVSIRVYRCSFVVPCCLNTGLCGWDSTQKRQEAMAHRCVTSLGGPFEPRIYNIPLRCTPTIRVHACLFVCIGVHSWFTTNLCHLRHLWINPSPPRAPRLRVRISLPPNAGLCKRTTNLTL